MNTKKSIGVILGTIILSLFLFSIFKSEHEKDAQVSTYVPVKILRINTNGTASICGSGTLFEGSNGVQILTAEHLFYKGAPESLYGYQTIPEAESEVAHPIAEVLNTGKDIYGVDADVTILKVGDAKPILGFSKYVSGDGDQTYSSEILIPKEEVWVTKLETGERARLIAIMKNSGPNGTGDMVLLDFMSTPGMSGSGFVMEDGGILVTKGSLEKRHEGFRLLSEKFHPQYGFTIAYGPLRFASN